MRERFIHILHRDDVVIFPDGTVGSRSAILHKEFKDKPLKVISFPFCKQDALEEEQVLHIHFEGCAYLEMMLDIVKVK